MYYNEWHCVRRAVLRGPGIGEERPQAGPEHHWASPRFQTGCPDGTGIGPIRSRSPALQRSAIAQVRTGQRSEMSEARNPSSPNDTTCSKACGVKNHMP